MPAIATNTNLGSLSFADLNHDGKTDLLIADRRGSDFTVLMGNGDGTYQAPKAYVSVAAPQSAGIVPLGDGSTAVLSSDGINGAVLLNFVSADGTVNSPPIQALGKALSAALVTDLNKDGKPDIIVTDKGGNRIYVLLNSGNYAFASAVSYPLGSSPAATAVADVTGDGRPDLVVADASGGVDILAGNGDGTFGGPMSVSVSGAGAGIADPVVADFNGDGRPDIAIAAGGQINILLGQGKGAFSPGATISVSGTVSPVSLVTGDFNRDGKPDLALAYDVQNANGALSGFIAIALGTGSGTFQTSTVQLSGSALSLAVGDVNKDGKLDLVAGLLEPAGVQVAVMLGGGDGTFHAPIGNITGTNAPSITIVDINGDGDADLLIGDCCGLSEATIMFGNGDGTFQAEIPFASGPNPAFLAAGDLDGDGKQDLVIAGSGGTGGTLVILHNLIPTLTPMSHRLLAKGRLTWHN